MFNLFPIISIAKYEAKTLFRSWFFRIFAIVIILFIFGVNMGMFSVSNNPQWELLAVGANLPYVNFQMLNFIQSIVAIFLAADFLRRDKTLDTTETIYIRPITNLQYVLGKTFGNLWVFMVLNLIVFGISIMFNLGLSEVKLELLPYLYYFLFLSFTSLLFIMGLSFFLMSLLKNQAITFVVLLSYMGVTLFYLQSKFFYILDYMGYKIPMIYSDFTGFMDLEMILYQRGIYFFFGVATVAFTVVLLKRLPHNKKSLVGAATTGALATIAAICCGYVYYTNFSDKVDGQEQILALNDQYSEEPTVDIKKYEMKLTHRDDSIFVDGTITVRNDNEDPMDQIILTLNPGLKISSVKGATVDRELSVVKLNLDEELNPKGNRKIEMEWFGTIEDYSSYLSTDPELRYRSKSIQSVNLSTNDHIMEDNYLVLTQENEWYPKAGVGIGNNSWGRAKQFSTYELTVDADDSLTVISQGNRKVLENGDVKFSNYYDLPQISLVIGKYDVRKVEVEGINMELYIKEGHNYFDKYLDQLGDTISPILAEMLGDFERELDLYYNFSNFRVVEVPVHYGSFDRILESGREEVQPGMVFIPEQGAGMNSLNLMGEQRSIIRSRKRNEESGIDTVAEQVDMLTNLVKGTFLSETAQYSWRDDSGRRHYYGAGQVMPYYIYPQFYNFVNAIESKEFPIMDRVMDIYLRSKASEGDVGKMFSSLRGGGASKDLQANVLLGESSIADLMISAENPKVLDSAIKLKGDYLFSSMESGLEDGEFLEFLKDVLYENQSQVLSMERLDRLTKRRFGIELSESLEAWYNQKALPAFQFQNVRAETIVNGEETMAKVFMDIYNGGDASGLVKITFMLGGGRRGGRSMSSMETINKLVSVEKGEAKRVSFILSGTPRMAMVNTLCSQNIPASLNFRFPDVKVGTGTPIEEDIPLDIESFNSLDDEILVDTEDPGFSIEENTTEPPLRKLINGDEEESKYSNLNFWRTPQRWTLTTSSDFIGKFVKSAYYCATGDGSRAAKWVANVTEEGYYDLYVYIPPLAAMSMRRGGGSGKTPEYTYSIKIGEDLYEVMVNVKGRESVEWVNLGRYEIKPGDVEVRLTNDVSTGNVYADAIKLVKNN